MRGGIRVSDGRIRILYLIDQMHLMGGTERQLILLAEQLPRARFEPVIGVLYENTLLAGAELKTPTVHLGIDGPLALRQGKLLWRLGRLLWENAFDILQTQCLDAGIYGPWCARCAGVRPYVISTRRNMYYWRQAQPWAFRALRASTRLADRVLANAERVAGMVRELEGIPQRKLTVIQNAVEMGAFGGLSREAARERLGWRFPGPVIGAVANMRPVKGLQVFLSSARLILKEIPRAFFVLVGSGPQRAALDALANAWGLSGHVLMLGNATEVSTVMSALDIAVQPSLSEGFSNVLLEYMASGRPAVATRVGDADLVVREGLDGLLVTPGDPQALAGAVVSLCRDPGRAEAMGKSARDRVARNWSTGAIVARYIELYEGIVGERRT